MRSRRLALAAPLVAPLAAFWIALAHAGTARAQDAPVTPRPAEATPAEATPPTDPNDEILERVLRSGCRDGVGDVERLVVSGGTTWAPTVARLCGDVLRSAPKAVVVPALAARARGSNGARGVMAIWSTIYGVWLGVATDVLFEVDGVRAGLIPPLVGMGGALALSLVVTGNHPIDSGQAWTIVSGLEFGTINGLLWSGGLDFSSKGVVGAGLATGIATTAVTVLVAKELHPTAGDIEVVRSGVNWGAATGLLGVAILADNPSSETILRSAAVAMDLGFLAGLALAASFNVSRNRDLLIDAGALGGAVGGFGVTALILGQTSEHGSVIAGGTLVGMYAGIITAIVLTGDMDDDEDDRAPSVAALFGRDERGEWHVGSPSAVPVFDGPGHRVVGATLTALAGSF